MQKAGSYNPQRLEPLLERLEHASLLRPVGRVIGVLGPRIKARLPGALLGAHVLVGDPPATLRAEVVAFDHDQVILLPLDRLGAISAGMPVCLAPDQEQVLCGDALIGRVLDESGRPLDDGPPLSGEPWSIMRQPPPALQRLPITEQLHTGVCVLDTLLPLAHGQRLVMLSQAGAGKSELLRRIARDAEIDVCVYALIGERGAEVRRFAESLLAGPARERLILIVSTSDAAPRARVRAAFTATAIAEYFRDRRGLRVLLALDSLTRVARAQREVGLAAGELPVREGFPPSLFDLLPQLLERAGNSAHGQLSAFYTVLSEARADDPLSAELASLADGHLLLSAKLAQRQAFPAIDVVRSLSRVGHLVQPQHVAQAAHRLRSALSTYDEKATLLEAGMLKTGADPELDWAVANWRSIKALLYPETQAPMPLAESQARLLKLVGA
ncbi:MAG: FliI/YscN family ATPase [Myxococcota bacterium]|jgi:FliI/YscN family ATPase|nr:FliI/YscN family ATPase [Myxococcota bacterium]